MESSLQPEKFTSVFEDHFDVVICGAGLIGYAAASRLAAAGRRVLLLEPGGDLLWETTRALENDAASPLPSPAWEEWITTIQAAAGITGQSFEPALAEAEAAHRLLSESPRIATLLYAVPVQVERHGNAITGLTLATKSGLRHLRAGHWVDTSEEGLLATLCGIPESRRLPQMKYRSLVIQSLEAASVEEAVAAIAGSHPGLECLPSVRKEERRLRWIAGSQPWHREVTALIGNLREQLADGKGSDFLVSHCAMRDFPVYAPTPPDEAATCATPGNLTMLSPSWRGESVGTLAERYELGFTGVGDLSLAEMGSPAADVPAGEVDLSSCALSLECEVVVAGAGTAGALAAIAAAKKGADTVAIDGAPFPGGIGTGGGITGYFHGIPGGLQDEVDQRAQKLALLLTGKTYARGWHHEAKKIALLELFEESGVRFIGEAVLFRVEHDSQGRVAAVFAAEKGRVLRLAAGAFIDSTGDGDLCALAGADFSSGREGDGRFLAYSQVSFSLTQSSYGLALKAFNFDAGWVDPTDPEDLSRARLAGLALYTQWDWKGETPLLALAPTLGLRHSRLIATDAKVTMAAMVANARSEEKIGVLKTLADTHSVDFEFESDPLAFYYWSCRGFRHPLACEIPYGALLPRGLANVWIACRAAGMDVDASYGFRMQREMQRLGEAAGIASALAIAEGCGSREVELTALQTALKESGAIRTDDLPLTPSTPAEWLSSLDEGKPGVHLWHLWQQWDLHHEEVTQRLVSPDRHVSFYAATVSAMAGDAAGEPRLLQALADREIGPTPDDFRVPGAFGECIDIPFWLQAVVLLRRIGGAETLPLLRQLASEHDQPFNVRTTLALTVERLAGRLGSHPGLLEIVQLLAQCEPPAANFHPARSLWRTLAGEAQKPLPNRRSLDTRQDHAWQFHLIVERAARKLGVDSIQPGESHRADPRGFVRRAFKEI